MRIDCCVCLSAGDGQCAPRAPDLSDAVRRHKEVVLASNPHKHANYGHCGRQTHGDTAPDTRLTNGGQPEKKVLTTCRKCATVVLPLCYRCGATPFCVLPLCYRCDAVVLPPRCLCYRPVFCATGNCQMCYRNMSDVLPLCYRCATIVLPYGSAVQPTLGRSCVPVIHVTQVLLSARSKSHCTTCGI